MGQHGIIKWLPFIGSLMAPGFSSRLVMIFNEIDLNEHIFNAFPLVNIDQEMDGYQMAPSFYLN